jgi:hypothetical protein
MLEKQMADSSAILFIYGDTHEEWIYGQMQALIKVCGARGRKHLTLCIGPPSHTDVAVEAGPHASWLRLPDGSDIAIPSSNTRHITLEEWSDEGFQRVIEAFRS